MVEITECGEPCPLGVPPRLVPKFIKEELEEDEKAVNAPPIMLASKTLAAVALTVLFSPLVTNAAPQVNVPPPGVGRNVVPA